MLNVTAIGFGIIAYRNYRARISAEGQFLSDASYFADGLTDEGVFTKPEALEGMLMGYHCQTDHKISDHDLDRMLLLINKEYDKHKTGDALIDFGDGFDRQFLASDPQREKIGHICITVACHATDPASRVFAIRVIQLLKIKGVREQLAPLIDDNNSEISSTARVADAALQGIKG